MKSAALHFTEKKIVALLLTEKKIVALIRTEKKPNESKSNAIVVVRCSAGREALQFLLLVQSR